MKAIPITKSDLRISHTSDASIRPGRGTDVGHQTRHPRDQRRLTRIDRPDPRAACLQGTHGITRG